MLAALLTLVAVQFTPDLPLTGQINCQCPYPETLRERVTGGNLVGCNRAAVEARDLCQIQFANDEISTIACTAIADGRSHLANFVVSRI